MPNWCMNRLTISHPDQEKIHEFVEQYRKGNTCEHYIPTKNKDNWYEEHLNNWGTKWDIGSEDNERFGLHPTVVENEASMTFDSAWSPPVGLYKRLEELGFTVDAMYWEPGMQFAGVWKDGINKEYSNYSGYEELPEQLVSEFNMQTMFEYDSEDEAMARRCI